ncbi:MAG: response regulator [Nitrospinae bacterium]|nr:response regulator [Nitrospinota bacterium]
METAVMRKLVRQCLATMGIEHIDEAVGIFSALKLLRGSRYDALIVEWGETGCEVVRAVRASPSMRETPVIVITKDIGDETLIRIAESGAKEVLHKPHLPSLLPRKISEMFPAATIGERGMKIAMLLTEEDER